MKKLETILKIFGFSIILLATILAFANEVKAQINPDGTTLNIEGATSTAMEGTITDKTTFDVYLPSVSLSQMLYLLVGDVKTKQNSYFSLKGVNYTVTYEEGVYSFNNVQFTNKKDLQGYLKPYLKTILLTN